MILQSHPGCFARAPPHPVNEGGMVEGAYVRLACSLLKMTIAIKKGVRPTRLLPHAKMLLVPIKFVFSAG